jgi:hypothetical protein
MKLFLGYLPDENKKDRLMDAFLNEIEKLDVGWSIDFVLMTIAARK